MGACGVTLESNVNYICPATLILNMKYKYKYKYISITNVLEYTNMKLIRNSVLFDIM